MAHGDMGGSWRGEGSGGTDAVLGMVHPTFLGEKSPTMMVIAVEGWNDGTDGSQ